MKKFEFNPGQSFVGIVAAVVLGILLAFYSLILLWPQGNPYDSVKVTIPKGASLKEVSTTLQDYNIIRNERSFLLAVKTLGYEKDIPAGRFKLVKASTNFEIIDQLVNGIQVNKRVTILEGWTIDVIAFELQDKIGINPDEFKNACTNELLLWKWGISEESVEGYLFPNTYLFSEEEDIQDIIGRMINEYKQRITIEFRDRMKELEMEEKEVITLASIIEGEAIYDKERPIISGVYHNRLNIGMRLQADPTIQYIIEGSPRRLLNKDLKIKSPYNTYLNKGLPPGPINNPGIESIRAALYPAKTDFLYFVARGDGYHTFSKTKEEHNIAKRKFQKIRRQLKKQQAKKDKT
ncbi:MAG: endolytic transglycosylase MltG [Candidatus Marinimicrobia bacterium]|nr:endolytic transglycosylase MltG [Candidatus Neomarinimicrobiota bacterium]